MNCRSLLQATHNIAAQSLEATPNRHGLKIQTGVLMSCSASALRFSVLDKTASTTHWQTSLPLLLRSGGVHAVMLDSTRKWVAGSRVQHQFAPHAPPPPQVTCRGPEAERPDRRSFHRQSGRCFVATSEHAFLRAMNTTPRRDVATLAAWRMGPHFPVHGGAINTGQRP